MRHIGLHAHIGRDRVQHCWLTAPARRQDDPHRLGGQSSQGRLCERKIILDHRTEGDQHPGSARFSQIGRDRSRCFPEQRANVVMPGGQSRVVVVKDRVSCMQDQRGLLQQGDEVTAKEQDRALMEIVLQRTRWMGADIEGRVDDAPGNAALCRHELRHPRTKQGGDEEVGALFV